MRIERHAFGLPLGRKPRAGPGGDARWRPHPDRWRGDCARHGTHPRHRDGSGHHHDRAPPVRSGDRRADRRHLVRESAALRRLRRDVAHQLRWRSPRPADAHAGGLSDARHRRIAGGSAEYLRNGGGGQLHHARPVLRPERLFDRAEPVPLDHGNRNGRGQADHHQPDVHRPALPAADPSAGAGLRRSRHQRTRGRGRGGLHAGGGYRARRSR